MEKTNIKEFKPKLKKIKKNQLMWLLKFVFLQTIILKLKKYNGKYKY